ncbi:WD_REPEATS_REGION domain-containing protein, partial [Mortierella sp. GBA43]
MSKVIDVVKTGYEGVSSLAKSGHGFVECLKEGLSFERRREWYAALRGADTLIRNGELATFKKLVCGAPCRYDPAFQWGVCQRLGEMASNPLWDGDTRRSSIAFLGEMYLEDEMWGDHANVKQWILNILMQLASTDPSTLTGGVVQIHTIVAETLLQDLQECDDFKKRDLYRESLSNGPIAYPLKTTLPELGSPSLLDRVQNRPDVEGNIRTLRKQRTKERGTAVYIPPQAKANIQAPEDARFPLMERMKTFLESDQQVFLILGDSGAGKSTFSRELEFELWQEYERKKERIPLHINLPAIENPEHDMIAKQLRKAEFTEPQIREMKHHRKFIVICDGYDEGQQTQNLYMTNKLNQSGEWDAKMVI